MKITEQEAMVFTKSAVDNATTLLNHLGTSLEITNDEQYADANEVLKHIVKEKRSLQEKKTWVLAPIKESMKRWTSLFGAPEKVLVQSEVLLKGAIAKYKTDKIAKSRSFLQEAAQSINHKETATLVSLAQQAVPQTDGVSTFVVWDFEVEDINQVPIEFLQVDEKAVRAVVKNMKNNTKIPGIKVFSKTSVSVRTK
jgi:hypothetical protein